MKHTPITQPRPTAYYRVTVDDGNGYFSDRKINYTKYDVLRYTPCGVWLEVFAGKGKFMYLGGRKQFASATKEDALVEFVRRKARHIRFLEANLRTAAANMAFAEGELDRIKAKEIEELKTKEPTKLTS